MTATHTDTHGLHLNQERRDRLFDLEAQTKVRTCTSSNRGDMYKCVYRPELTHASFLCAFWPFFWDTHKRSDTFWSCALITSSRLILGQRWTPLTRHYWLVQLVTVISCRVIWRWPCCSQTAAANLAPLQVIIQLFTLRRAGGDECRKMALLI